MFVLLSEYRLNEYIQPVCRDSGAQSADGVGKNGLPGIVGAAQYIHHGNMGAEIPAPAHTHGGEHGQIPAVCLPGGHQSWNDTQCGACGAQCRHRHGDGCPAGKTKQGLQQEVDLFCKGGQQCDALIRGAGVLSAVGRAAGEHHNQGADDQQTGDNGHAQLHAGFAAVHHGGEQPCAAFTGRVLCGGLFAVYDIRRDGIFSDPGGGEEQHQPCADDAAV